MTRGRKTYRVDLRRPATPEPVVAGRIPADAPWTQQTRKNRKQDAELERDMWQARGFEVRIVEEP